MTKLAAICSGRAVTQYCLRRPVSFRVTSPSWRALIGLLAMLGIWSNCASAAVTVYSDRGSWNSNASLQGTEDFESYAWSQNGGDILASENSSVSLGALTYQTPSNVGLFGVSPAVTYRAAYLSGNHLEFNLATTYGSPLNQIAVTLPSAVTALAFDFGQFWGGVTPFEITLDTGDTVSLSSTDDAYLFFGVISDTPFASFSITAAGAPVIDNLAWGTGTDQQVALSLSLSPNVYVVARGGSFTLRGYHTAMSSEEMRYEHELLFGLSSGSPHLAVVQGNIESSNNFDPPIAGAYFEDRIGGGGYLGPSVIDGPTMTEVSDLRTFVVPTNAVPGTYRYSYGVSYSTEGSSLFDQSLTLVVLDEYACTGDWAISSLAGGVADGEWTTDEDLGGLMWDHGNCLTAVESQVRKEFGGNGGLFEGWASVDLNRGLLRQSGTAIQGGSPTYDEAYTATQALERLVVHVPDGGTGTLNIGMNVWGNYSQRPLYPGAELSTMFGNSWAMIFSTAGQDNVVVEGSLASADALWGTSVGTAFRDRLTTSQTVSDGQIVILQWIIQFNCFVFSSAECSFDLGQSGWIDISSPDGVTFTSSSGRLLAEPYVPESIRRLEQLASDVAGLETGKSLAAKIREAQRQFAVPNVVATCGLLGAFINEVTAQSGKKIETGLADRLFADAREAMTAVGCE